MANDLHDPTSCMFLGATKAIGNKNIQKHPYFSQALGGLGCHQPSTSVERKDREIRNVHDLHFTVVALHDGLTRAKVDPFTDREDVLFDITCIPILNIG